MKFLSVFIVLFFLLLSCATLKKQNRNYQKITGVKPVYIKADSSVFVLVDPIMQLPNLDFAYIDSSITGSQNSFSLQLKNKVPLFLKTPNFLYLTGNDNYIYFVYPDCELQVKQDKNGDIQLRDLKGSIEQNNEINYFQKLIKKTGRLNWENYGKYMNADSSIYNFENLKTIESEINNLKKQRLFFLDSFNRSSPISSDFYNLVKDITDNVALHDSMLLYFDFKDFLLTQNLYNKKLQNLIYAVNKKSGNLSFYFDIMCTTLLNLIENKQPHTVNMYSETEFYNSSDSICKYFLNNAKDYLLYNKFLQASGKYYISDTFFNVVYKNVTNESFRKLIMQAKERMSSSIEKSNNEAEDYLKDLSGNRFTLKDLKKKFQGKYIYMDLWASWCAPCRDNFPFSRKLMEEYKNKDIVFLFVSIEKDESRWKVASITEGLSNQNSLFFLNFNNTSFKKAYEIESIPRYLLFNKNGEIIISDAPMPQIIELKSILNELLQ